MMEGCQIVESAWQLPVQQRDVSYRPADRLAVPDDCTAVFALWHGSHVKGP